MDEQNPHHRHRPDAADESVAAAESVTDLTGKQSAVLRLIRQEGPLSDHRMVELYLARFREEGWPEQSESGLRTRRSELYRRGWLAKDAGKALLPSGRYAARWRTLRPGEEPDAE